MNTELPALPADFQQTRDALHQVAEKVLAPARSIATGGEFSLVPTEDGFGTPKFPDGGSARVEISDLVVESISGEPVRVPLTTLRRAALAVGLDGDDLDDVGLAIDERSAAVLAYAYHFASGVLEELKRELGENQHASAITLWPEHFDVAFEMGIESEGRRAGYGLSPGDENHSEPYLYVGPWAAPVDMSGWNATGFTGAELGWSDLSGAEEPRQAALVFFRKHFEALQRA